NHGNAARDGEQPANLKVLARLRLDGFVGGDHQQHQVDPANSGQHVADKALVAGDINESQAQLGSIFVAPLHAAGRVEFQVREAKINGDAAPLLFFQAVGIDAGQGFHQRGLAVVNVAGGADDDGFHYALV